MNTLDEFDALVTSFGESLVMHIGRDHLDALEVRGYEESSDADVLVWLESNSWDSQLRAISGIEEVRAMFMGEIFFEYRFLDSKEQAPPARDAAEFSLTR